MWPLNWQRMEDVKLNRVHKVLLTTVALLLVGCSTRLAYHNVDWLAMQYIDDYVSLNSDQEAVLEKRLQYLHEWHQGRELTLYADHLLELKSISANDVTVEFIEQHQNRIEQHWQRLLDKAAPELYSLVTQLDRQQKAQLLENLAQEYQERNEKYQDQSEAELRELYQERITEFAEEWLGTLTKQQQQWVIEWSNELVVTTSYWREYRAQYYQHAEKLLAEQHAQTQIALLNQALYQNERFFSPEMKRALDHNRAVFSKYVIKFANSLNDKQWRYYRAQVDDWYQLAADLSLSAVPR